MIGRIQEIDGIDILVELGFDVRKVKSILNDFVLIKDNQIQFIGEIIEIKNGNAVIRLLGEFKDGRILYGTIRRPSFASQIFFISKEFVPTILGSKSEAKTLKLGKSTLYETDINAEIDTIFGCHFAIFGSTGSGKSCGLARIIQNIFSINPPKSARIMIFDAYGEYKSAFSNFSKGIFKLYTTNVKSDEKLLKVPLWLLTKDDIALLLNATKSTQILIIDKALRFLNVFARTSQEARAYKNSIIASALLEILLSGRTPVRIRDQVLAILAKYNTEDLNTETKIVQPGYIRTIKQCMYIDKSGKINSIELVEAKLQEFIIQDIDLTLPDGTYKFTLTDLLDF